MNNKDMKDKTIEIILIVVIIVLLIHNYIILNSQKLSTFNVDVIDIKCGKSDVCVFSSTINHKKYYNPFDANVITKKNEIMFLFNGKRNYWSGNLIKDYDLIVNDDEVTWIGSTQAKIFTNSMNGLNNVIAPESSNTYQFTVTNRLDCNLKYDINFVENNRHNINMKYKLKKNDIYIVDYYVSYDELNVSNALLNTKASDTYYLEWKWISSDNDTKIGKSPNSKYELMINVKAESIND